MADPRKFLAALERIGRALNTQTQDDYTLVPPLIEKENDMPTPLAPTFSPTLVQRMPRRTRSAGREHLRIRSREGVVVHDGTQPRYVAEWDIWHVGQDGTASLLSGHGTGKGALHHLPHLLHEVGLTAGTTAGGVHDAA